VPQRSPEQPVIVVGAGPTGLALSCELAAAGIACTVLERRAAPSAGSRAMTLFSRTMEILDLRGHAGDLAAAGRPVTQLVTTVGSPLDFAELDSPFAYANVIPQSRTEEVLQRRALDLGVTIERETEVTGLLQGSSEVTVQARNGGGGWERRAGYVVGCDGAGSIVRRRAGIGFRGRTYELAPILGDVRLRKPPPDALVALPGRGGILVAIPYGDGRYRIGMAFRDMRWTDRDVTLEEFGERLTAAVGFDPQPYDPGWLARFRIHQRIADRYRSGRVLLAGDAAHVHSPLGGQGLNLGIQDAVNLGWKLAAEIRGWAPPGLLDSYQAERRPHALHIVRSTDRATRLVTHPSPLLRTARKAALGTVLSSARLRRRVAAAMTGLSSDYAGHAMAGGPRLRAGSRVPDLTLPGPGASRLYELMRDGRFLLLDLHADGPAVKAAAPWGDRVTAVHVTRPVRELAGVGALLIRPDGFAGWVEDDTEPGDRGERARAALHRWCGAETTTAGAAAGI
jgi:2-polyprenyl-6-methoxyphenol hydroxylase-like FAD-dependent oxidoreductase